LILGAKKQPQAEMLPAADETGLCEKNNTDAVWRTAEFQFVAEQVTGNQWPVASDQVTGGL
jgi:hypothetical protein